MDSNTAISQPESAQYDFDEANRQKIELMNQIEADAIDDGAERLVAKMDIVDKYLSLREQTAKATLAIAEQQNPWARLAIEAAAKQTEREREHPSIFCSAELGQHEVARATALNRYINLSKAQPQGVPSGANQELVAAEKAWMEQEALVTMYSALNQLFWMRQLKETRPELLRIAA